MGTPVAAAIPRMRFLLLEWFGDVLISLLVALPFGIPLVIEQNALQYHDVEVVDVWQFESMPRDHRGLRAWGASQSDRSAFRVDVLTPDEIVLRYIRDKNRVTVPPDWRRLGYSNARLLSSDSSPVRDADLPRSALGWWCEVAASLAAVAVLRRRLNRVWSPLSAWKIPAMKSWRLAGFIFLATVAIDLTIRWWRSAGTEPLTSTGRVMPQLNGWSLSMAWCAVAVAGPAFEEILFRGCLLGRFRKHGYVASGIVLSAVAFAVGHRVPVLMPNYFCKGLLLAWLCHRADSLWPSLAVHVAWNIVAQG